MSHPRHNLAKNAGRARIRDENNQANRQEQAKQNKKTPESRKNALRQSGTPTKATQQAIHRKSYTEMMRQNFKQFRQTRLRPTIIPAGGDHYFGDIRRPPKGSCRMFFQNVGGFPTTEPTRWTSLAEVASFSASFIGLQETKLNETHSKKMMETRKAIHKQLRAKAVLKSNNDTFTESHRKPGGIATLLRNGLRSKKNTIWTDPTTLIQRTRIITEGVKMSIVNIYLPRPDTGAMSTYSQALNTIRTLREWATATNVDEYFYEKLHTYIEQDAKEGYYTIIGGDFNDDHKKGSRMTTTLEGLSMLNITSPPGEKTPATYNRGRRTLDHIWISSSLAPLITGYGYLPYDLGFDSDHRGMYVDIKCRHGQHAVLPKRNRRKLNSKNSKLVKAYLSIVRQKVKKQNIEARLARLECRDSLTEQDIEELMRIDETMTNIMLGAEAKLQQNKTNDSFHIRIHELKRIRHYWRKMLHLSKVTSHYSLRKYQPLHNEEDLKLPRRILLAKIRKASEDIEEMRKNIDSKRQEMLQEMVRHMAERSGKEAEADTKGIKSLMHAERSRMRYAELRTYRHPAHKETRNLEIPDVGGDVDKMWRLLKEERKKPEELNWITIEKQEEISEFMIRWCIRHFGQAIGTPLSDSTWKNRLDPRLGTKILDEIVSGKYIAPKGCPPELLHLLKAARQPHGAQDIPFTMSFEHFRKFCERQDEKKTSSPSGLHYGHYKTLTWDELLLRIKYKILEIAYKHGVLLRRWTILWEILLQKKERAFIHKFRNITLIEGDIQYLMKAIWSQTLMKAITSHLHPNQNALRGKVTQSSVLSHRIALDTMFVNGKKCIVIKNDAVNCFD